MPDREIAFSGDTPFIDQKGRVQVPVSFLTAELGAKVDWKEKLKTASIVGNGKVIELVPGKSRARINETEVFLDSGPALIKGRIFLPVRFIVEQLGGKVDWDKDTSVVKIIIMLPLIRDYGLSYVRVADGWCTVPRTFTAWVTALNAKKVDFYLTPTGTGQEPVKIATSYSNEGNFSITYTLPQCAIMAHFWAEAVNDNGRKSTEILNVYRGVTPDPPVALENVPIHPSFDWKLETDQSVLIYWLGSAYNKEGNKFIASTLLQKTSSQEIINWYLKALEEAGWESLTLDGSQASWRITAVKEDSELEIYYGSSGVDGSIFPEKGVRIIAAVKTK